jgi:hypothetical protein
MLEVLDDFRKKLSDTMISCMDKRIILYGYSYTGRFLRWYASYYHAIDVDFVITEDWSAGVSFDQEIFRPTFFNFNYKDTKNCVVWLAVPFEGEAAEYLKREGFRSDAIYDFYNIIYGDDIEWPNEEADVFHQRKTGLREIQFLEYLEWKYGCNFLTKVNNTEFKDVNPAKGTSYVTNTQKEIFEIFDKIHHRPDKNDAIVDLGCGKCGAMLSLLDYGFPFVGGVEYETGLYEVALDNMKKLGLDNNPNIEIIHADATKLKEELDKYNWFYMFSPFYDELFEACINNIIESIHRNNRKVRIVYANPHCHKLLEKTGAFRLVSQFTFTSRQRVVKVYESI